MMLSNSNLTRVSKASISTAGCKLFSATNFADVNQPFNNKFLKRRENEGQFLISFRNFHFKGFKKGYPQKAN
jgi:hypothetical protein